MERAESNLALAIVLGLLAALAFAFGAVFQHRAAHREEQTSMVSPTLVLRLLRRPLWLFGILVGGGGIVLQASAAHFGSLTLVQCLLIGQLVFVVPVGALLDRRRIVTTDVIGVLLCATGVVSFLTLTHPTEGSSRIPASEAAQAGAVIAVAVALCLFAAHRSSADRRAALLGSSAGIVIGTLDALIKSSSDLAADGVRSVLTDWPIYALCGVGILVLIFEQNALRSGRLPAAQAGISMLEPVTGILIGAFAFHDKLSTSTAAILVEVLAAIAALAGIAMVSGSNSRWEESE